jgi:uncharacterized protein (TIGR03545 family)
MQVASPRDPWKNLLETRRVKFAMDAGQLLRGKYIIETMEVNDLIVGTKRTTSGEIPGAQPVAPEQQSSFSDLAMEVLERTVEKTPIFDPAHLRHGINVDSLVKAIDLRSIAHIDTLKQQALGLKDQWTSAATEFESSKQRLAQIEASIRAINPNALNTADRIMSALQTVNDAKKGIDEISGTVYARSASVQADIKRVSASVGELEAIAREDYKKVLGLARLPDLDATGLAAAVFGPSLVEDVRTGLYWMDFARAKIAEYSPKPDLEKPPRMKGQNIHFPVERAYPKLWIRNILISGGTDATQDTGYIYAKGQVKDVTNDQRITGRPLLVDLSGTKGGTLRASLGAKFDRTRAEPLDEYRLRVAGIRLAAFPLGSQEFLPATMTGASLASALDISIPGRTFDAQAGFEFRTIRLQYARDPKNTVERLVRDVLSGVNGFDMDLRLWNTSGQFKAALATDLDARLADRLKSVLGAELTKIQNEVRARIDAEIADKRKEFDEIYLAKRNELEKQLTSTNTQLAQVLALVDQQKKDLEAKLEKEKKGAIDGALKKLLKK